MNSIFGRININQNPINKELFNESVKILTPYTSLKTNSIVKNDCAFSQVLYPPFKNNNNQSPILESGYIIVSDCALYNRSELLERLKLPDRDLNDNLIILSAYLKWGKDCLANFLGDFAFAVWDEKSKELFCARDHFGVKPFNYYFDGNSFALSSDISSITAQTDLKLSIDEQYIADTISIVKSEKFRSTYNEIRKLPPANYLTLNNGKIEIQQYWELKTQKILIDSDEEIIKNFRSILTESIRCRVDNENKIGAELSGGLDSSSITAIAKQFMDLKTFSHVLPEHLLNIIFPFKDEHKFINLLTDYTNIKDRHFITSEKKSLIDSINQNIDDFRGLTQQNFGVFSDQLYKSAAHKNISVLLSGFGGDEVVTSKSSGYLLELALNKEWTELKNDLRNQNLSNFQFLQVLFKYYLKAKIPIVSKIIASLKNKEPWWQGKYENLAINNDFSEKLKIKERYFANYKNDESFSLQEKNIERITHPHVSQRLEYCSLIARKYGIEYRYPLLDKRLIEYYLAIPTRLKARDGIGRYVIRRAIEGMIPEKIQWRNDKSGATIPTVFMRTMHDKERILNIIYQARPNEIINSYININKYEQWFDLLCKRSESKLKYINPGAFYNYLKLILFIEKNPELFK